MADAKDVLRETIAELNLLAGSGGKLDELQQLAKLGYEAWNAMEGGKPVPDKDAKILHPSRWSRLGINP